MSVRSYHVISCILLFASGTARADALSDTVCPILKDVVAGAAGNASFAVQAELVMAVGGAYNFNGETLKTVLNEVDASTTLACPELRDAVLRATEMPTLYDAMR